MDFSIVGDRDPFLLVRLNQGESVYAESKLANGESFFNQALRATRGPGEALLAPILPGDLQILEVSSSAQYLLNDGAFVAAEPSVDLVVKSQGLGQALFGGTGGFFVMKTAGQGKLAVAGFGSVFALAVSRDNDVLIDNQHVIAWDSRLDYDISVRTSRSRGLLGNLVNSVTSGEGLVTRFSGEGKVYVSSRNMANFVQYIAARMAPPR